MEKVKRGTQGWFFREEVSSNPVSIQQRFLITPCMLSLTASVLLILEDGNKQTKRQTVDKKLYR